MASQLDIPLSEKAANPRNVHYDKRLNSQIKVNEQSWVLGWASEKGFCFDNELPPEQIALSDFEIDSQPLSWSKYLEFLQATGHPLPKEFSFRSGELTDLSFGTRRQVDLREPVSHVNWHDAQAYCQWAERELPSEVQWECAAMTQPDMKWGWVWEWTSSPFTPFDGFIAHPYTAYSQPWFGTRKVLKGASWATSEEMVSEKYRNFFQPDRTDILSGFRTCRHFK